MTSSSHDTTKEVHLTAWEIDYLLGNTRWPYETRAIKLLNKLKKVAE